MWCNKCQSDVAGEVSPDAKSLLCTTCGSEVSSIKAPVSLPARSARQLLERWDTEEALDPYQPRGGQEAADEAEPDLTLSYSGEVPAADFDDIAASTQPSGDRGTTADPQREQNPARVARRPSRRTLRVDEEHAAEAGEPAHAPHPPRDVYGSHGSRVDESHTAVGPHFNIESAFDRRKPGRGESLWGQLLAYAGVGVLTIGTGLVVWGYFGGPEGYTPTGWLLATAGQMLLFLGVVTLISGGMEQTTHEVTQRIELLGDHIIRIERHTSEQSLRGPHFDTTETADAEAARTETVNTS